MFERKACEDMVTYCKPTSLDRVTSPVKNWAFLFMSCLALGTVLFAARPAASAEKVKIAVSDLKAFGVSTSIAMSVSDLLRTELFRSGYFRVMERAQMNKILEEQAFQLTGATEGDIAKMGKLLAVQLMVMGSINRLGAEIIVNTRVVDVEEGMVKAAESVTARSEEQLPRAIQRLALQVSEAIPLRGKVVGRREGAIFVSLGSQDRIYQGMTLRVQRLGKAFIEEGTNKILGRPVIEIALLRVGEVMDESLSKTYIVEKYAETIELGDIVAVWVGGSGEEGRQDANAPVVAPSTSAPAIRTERAPAAPPSGGDSKWIMMLRSGKPKEIKAAARYIMKSPQQHPELIRVANMELIEGFRHARDRHMIDAMAWLCNVLGVSADLRYRATLIKVARMTKNRKLKGYAKKNLARLK